MKIPRIDPQQREYFTVEGCDQEFATREEARKYVIGQVAEAFFLQAKMEGVFRFEDIFRLPKPMLETLGALISLSAQTDEVNYFQTFVTRAQMKLGQEIIGSLSAKL